MAKVVVTGGGVVGVLAAMLLADDDHDVTLLERDGAEAPDPDRAWEDWDRRGVNQFRQLHFFQPRFRVELERWLPDVAKALDDAGARRINLVTTAPWSGPPRPGDEQLDALTGRRPVVEAVIARAAATRAGLTVRRGTGVAGLRAGDAVDGVPRVVGVRTEDGEDLDADVVVDATGRRSPLPAWLAAIGARPPDEELEDSGFVYYGRHFRGDLPDLRAPALSAMGSVSILVLPADNGTWGVGVIAWSKDAELRGLKDNDRWMRAVSRFPAHAHWAAGEPVDDVSMITKIEDRHRSFVVDGRPVACGVLAVGDSWACTNPSVGRGASIGLLHAIALRDTLRDGVDDPVGLARRWHDATGAEAERWYRATLEFDRRRLAEIEQVVTGSGGPQDDPMHEITKTLECAARRDPDVLRGFSRIGGVLALADEVMAQPGFFDKAIAAGAGWRDDPLPAPTREELLAAIA